PPFHYTTLFRSCPPPVQRAAPPQVRTPPSVPEPPDEHLESVLGATPHEFESRILRQCLTGHDVEGPHRLRWGPSTLPVPMPVLVRGAGRSTRWHGPAPTLLYQPVMMVPSANGAATSATIFTLRRCRSSTASQRQTTKAATRPNGNRIGTDSDSPLRVPPTQAAAQEPASPTRTATKTFPALNHSRSIRSATSP